MVIKTHKILFPVALFYYGIDCQFDFYIKDARLITVIRYSRLSILLNCILSGQQ